MDIKVLYQIFLNCTGVTTDSRNCLPGTLFIALKGDSFNGNAFAEQALSSGCSYVVIDEPEYAIEGDYRFIVVNNSLETLQQLANYHRKQINIKVIGITGTNGKTTTKELISTVLAQSYQVLYTLGNLNNHIGVPLTLLRLTKDHEIAVIEMGANHPGEIKALAEIADPDYGIITNVGKAHLEGFGSFEGVIKTKGELYEYLRKKEASVVFIHWDNPYLKELSEGLTLIPYGTSRDLYINGSVTGNSPFLCFEWRTTGQEENHPVNTQLIGEYNFPNALAAVAIGHYFGIEASKINEALHAYTPQNNRSQLKQTRNNTLIIDAYNANPTSMMAALQNFRNMSIEHKMLIIGDMRELGVESAVEHQRIIDFIDTCDFETVILVGELFATTRHTYLSYLHAAELITDIKAVPPHGKTILIKGSNGIKLNAVADFLIENA